MTHNLIIIGSGPAAWTAAIYAARAELKPLVIAGEQPGGQLMLTTKVENYPGFADGVMGQDLMAAMRQQAEKLGVEIIDKNATALKKDGDNFLISVISSTPSSLFLLPSSFVTASAVIIATGATANTLKLPGEDRLMGRGVGTCAVCDAPFYKGKNTVFVIGGGDSAMEESIALAKFAKKVILVVRSESLRASEIMKNRIKSYTNIQIWYKSQVKEFIGDQKLERVRIERNGTVEDVAADGVFYAIGHTPATGWLNGSGVEIDEKGYIKTYIDYGFGTLPRNNEQNNIYPTMTSLSGIFAAGDCVDPRYRQAITAAGQGCMAALDVERWLDQGK